MLDAAIDLTGRHRLRGYDSNHLSLDTFQSLAYQEWVGPDNDIYDEVFADVAR